MTTNTNYNEHVAIMKKLKMADSFYEVREPFKESFEKIYEEAQSQNVTVSNAKEFLNSLSQEELSTLQHYTLLVDEIEVDSLSDEGAYNLLLHHYEKYDFNNDGIMENGIGKTQSLIPQSLDNTTKEALVETFNSMDFGEVLMTSMSMFPLHLQMINGEIVPQQQEYSYNDILNNIERILDPQNKNVSSQMRSSIGEFFELFTKNYNQIKENEATLSSYTRTNSINPAHKENTTTQKDTQLFKSITEDNYIAYDEIKNLSYEQIVQLKDFVMKKDEDNNYIQSSFMNHDKKAGMLLGTVSISDNNTFNKAIFNIAKKIDDEKVFETFIYDMTGTQLSDKLMAYPELQEIDYSKQDVKAYLSEKIANYQVKLNLSTTDEEKEFYQSMIGIIQGVINNYKSIQGESIHEKKTDPLEELRALVEDIISMFRTGFTVEELEYIEKLIKEIRKLLKEQEGKNDISDEELEKQIKAIEEALLALEKRLNGVAIIEMDDENTANKNTENSSFESRLNAIQKKVNEMKSGKYNQPIDSSTKDEKSFYSLP